MQHLIRATSVHWPVEHNSSCSFCFNSQPFYIVICNSFSQKCSYRAQMTAQLTKAVQSFKHYSLWIIKILMYTPLAVIKKKILYTCSLCKYYKGFIFLYTYVFMFTCICQSLHFRTCSSLCSIWRPCSHCFFSYCSKLQNVIQRCMFCTSFPV